jgi:hypothetical protein
MFTLYSGPPYVGCYGPGFLFFESDGALDKKVRNHPNEWKKQDPKDKPRERKPKNTPAHQFGEKVIQQRQTEEDNDEGRRARDRQPQLPAHESVEERLAMWIGRRVVQRLIHAVVFTKRSSRFAN